MKWVKHISVQGMVFTCLILMATVTAVYLPGGSQPTRPDTTIAESRPLTLYPVIRPMPTPNDTKPPNPTPPPIIAMPPLISYIETSSIMEITAYNAGDIDQCDGDPCISASGENLCTALDKGLKRCAANFVPLGTNIWIEAFGYCRVTDRMNRRFKHRVDIAMPLAQKQQALAFGLQNRKVKVFARM